MKKNMEVIEALNDMKRQVEYEEWAIYTNDRGSGSAGVRYLVDIDVIDSYLYFAKTGDNSRVQQCQNLYYVPVNDFTEEENEVIDEILDMYPEEIERDEILGFVIAQENYDMEYTFYMAHIRG